MIWDKFLSVLKCAEARDQRELKSAIDEFNRCYRRLSEAQQGEYHYAVSNLMLG